MDNNNESHGECCRRRCCRDDASADVPAACRESSGLPNVALVGNANTGKTTLFNSLTGLRQHVGNYPGVTVTKYSGPLKLFHGEKIELTDLPGIYSLAAASLDERVVIDVLSGRLESAGTPKPDAIVCVADVNNLRRNLFLATQVAELGIPMVLVLNQIDVARKDGLVVNTDLLRERLGIPVIAVSARRGEGIDAVRQAIADVLKNGDRMKTVSWNAGTRKALAVLRGALSEENSRKISDAELQRVIFDVASPIADRFAGEDIEKIGAALKEARECIRAAGENPHSTEALQRYEFIRETLAGATRREKDRTTFTSIADKLLLHRVFGVAIFLAAMYGVFWCIYTLAAFPMDWIDGWFGALGEWVGSHMESMPIAQSLVVDGVIGGVGGVLVFLPQILILFFFLGLLESTGYMARAAFLMDKLFGWCGLNGKSFVPMLSGYACGIPGIMSARTIEDPKARLATILAVPFMSCGARMPVYVLMCALLGRITDPTTASTVFVAMYFVGILVAVPVAWIYTRFVLKSKAAPFVLEMPRYQLPRLRDVGLRVWQSGLEYTRRAGTIIFAMSVVVWALSYFPRSEETADAARAAYVAEQSAELGVPAEVFEKKLADAEAAETPDEAQEEIVAAAENRISEAYLENSYLGRFGKFCQPVFAPAGFDWRITVGVLGSFPARELIVSTLGITYSLGGDVDEENEGLYDAMEKTTHADGSPVFTIPVIVGIMVFFALCGQCLAEIVVIARESSWKWAIVAWAQMTFLAWLGAVLCYQIGSLL